MGLPVRTRPREACEGRTGSPRVATPDVPSLLVDAILRVSPSGRAPVSGTGLRRFDSCRSDRGHGVTASTAGCAPVGLGSSPSGHSALPGERASGSEREARRGFQSRGGGCDSLRARHSTKCSRSSPVCKTVPSGCDSPLGLRALLREAPPSPSSNGKDLRLSTGERGFDSLWRRYLPPLLDSAPRLRTSVGPFDSVWGCHSSRSSSARRGSPRPA